MPPEAHCGDWEDWDMSEHNPFAAPTGAPGLAPMVAPPTGLLPASPMAPPPPAPPPPVGVPAQAVRFDHPASTLTELSFAPVATDEPPAEELVAAPPTATLNNSILPTGGGAGRSLSLGGRVPLIALALIALLAVVAVVFGTGLLGGDKAEPAPITKKTTSAPAKPTTTKGFKAFPVAAGSGTIGRSYSIEAPASWTTKSDAEPIPGPANTDLVIGSNADGLFVQSMSVPLGGTLSAMTKGARSGLVKGGRIKTKGDIRKTRVAGAPARQFDVVHKDGSRMRVTTFVDGNTVYLVYGGTSKARFAKYAPTYDRVLKSWKFTGK